MSETYQPLSLKIQAAKVSCCYDETEFNKLYKIHHLTFTDLYNIYGGGSKCSEIYQYNNEDDMRYEWSCKYGCVDTAISLKNEELKNVVDVNSYWFINQVFEVPIFYNQLEIVKRLHCEIPALKRLGHNMALIAMKFECDEIVNYFVDSGDIELYNITDSFPWGEFYNSIELIYHMKRFKYIPSIDDFYSIVCSSSHVVEYFLTFDHINIPEVIECAYEIIDKKRRWDIEIMEHCIRDDSEMAEEDIEHLDKISGVIDRYSK